MRSSKKAGGTDFPPPCGQTARKGDLKPHRIRYWLTPSEDEHYDAKVTDICDLYREAPALVQSGERVMSTDELTGVQALERKHPGLPLAPGKVERREFEYIRRHGTRSFIISRDVVTGQIVEPYGGPRRTEADFLQHVEAVIASDRAAQRWHFVVDNLDTHRSESLVRWVARESGLDLELGKKGKWGTWRTESPGPHFSGSQPLYRVSLHPQAHVMDEPSGNLAEHSGAKTATARVIQIGTDLKQKVWDFRLLQPDHGKALQMDLPRQGAGRMNCRVIYAHLY